MLRFLAPFKQCRYFSTKNDAFLPITLTLSEFAQKYQRLVEKEMLPLEVHKVGGRIQGKRKVSKDLLFLDISSNGQTLQVMLDRSKYSQSYSYDFTNLQRGDIIGAEGYPARTESGELSIVPHKIEVLSKCDHNIPVSNWTHKRSLRDAEVRFQKRYLDLIVNNEVKEVFIKRAKIIKFLRNFLDARGFLEVETPILSAKAGIF